MTIAIDDTALRYESHLGSGQLPWSSFTGLRTTDRIVAFMRGRRPLAYLPTSAFGSAQERDEVVAFVRERIAIARVPSSAGSRAPGVRVAEF